MATADVPTPRSVLNLTERPNANSAPILRMLAALANDAVEWERKHIMYVAAVKERGEDPGESGSVREAYTYRMAFGIALRRAVSALWPVATDRKYEEVCEHLKGLSGERMYLPGWSEYVAKRDAKP